MGGFVKLDRDIRSSGWYPDANTLRVYIHLLLTANFRDGEFMGVVIHRGEVATSYPSIADALGLSVQNVRTSLRRLKSTGMVTAKIYSKFQVISMVNYDCTIPTVTSTPTGNQQATNSNRRREERNINNTGENGPTQLPELCQIDPETDVAAWAERRRHDW